MAETQSRPTGSGHIGFGNTGFGHAEVALAVGLSAGFGVLAVVVSPLLAAVVVIPASVAVGRWRAHTLPGRSPHSLSVPVYESQAVIHAPKVSASSGDKSVTTAA